MTADAMQDNTNEVRSLESRTALVKMVLKLFELWDLPTADQLELLGLSAKSESILDRYAKGEELPEGSDTLARLGWLLAIHKALRLLYPQNPEIRYSWVTRRNEVFGNLRPLDLMKEQGIIGLARVFCYLDFYRGECPLCQKPQPLPNEQEIMRSSLREAIPTPRRIGSFF